LPLSEKLTPAGKLPLLSLGVGYPLVLTTKLKAVPAVSVTAAALLKVGAWFTVRVKAWFVVPVEFLAVKVSGKGPLAVAAAVPARVAVPLACAVNVTPEGSVPVLVSVGVGVPTAVIVKLNAVPPVAVALFALVMASPLFTVRTKVWLAVPAEFLAVTVRV
jgi:hypothetical protein